MKNTLLVAGVIFGALLPGMTHAQSLTLRHRHFLFTVPASVVESWTAPQDGWQWQGQAIRPPQELQVDGDILPEVPDGMARTASVSVSRERIAEYLQKTAAASLARQPGSVIIQKSTTGGITFEGVGLPGRSVDVEESAAVIAEALKQGVHDIVLVVHEEQPSITVDPELEKLGVTSLIAIGESDFSGSTQNRIHNVKTGLRRFNGHLVAKGETFSFVKVLGPVDARAGYRKELTILGDKTLPDYGGGLCQVSTTAYRGVWEYGFPIVQRRNHSYTVGYYSPQGTDATIYPPHTDIKFKNDSPGALVIQTHTEGTKAYFLYYGTKDVRSTTIVGPFTWGRSSPPPPKTEYTDEIPEGTRRKVGDAVPGMQAAWYRFVQTEQGEPQMETVLSTYQARPLFYQIGGADPASIEPTETPDWLEVDPSA